MSASTASGTRRSPKASRTSSSRSTPRAARSPISPRAGTACSRRSWTPASTSRPTGSGSRWPSTPRRRPYRERTNLDIYVIPTDGTGALKDLTSSNPYTDDSPRFAPDGRSIYYIREAKYTAGNRRIARVDLASGASTTLTNAYDRSFDAVSFSPDGKALYAGSEDRGVVAIFRLSADGIGALEAVRRRHLDGAFGEGRLDRAPQRGGGSAGGNLRARRGPRLRPSADEVQRRSARRPRARAGPSRASSAAPAATPCRCS